MSNPVGRPSKYNADIQAMADDYLYRLKDLGHAIPSRAGLCCYLGIAKSTSFDWADQYPEFSDALKKIDVMQEHLTLNGGIKGTFNSTIAKLVLANHGYSEKQAVDLSSSDGTMSPKPALDTSKLSTSALKELMAAHESDTTDGQ